jgi:glycosyltransferase involved in cell wall biosynthesis
MARHLARERLGLSQDEVLVIFPHDATQPTKRIGLAEAAVAHLRRRRPRARLWIVNNRSPDEMPLYYGAADVMIVTSLCEGGPSSVKEALACGIPVVSVPVGDTALFEEVPRAVFRADASPEALSAALDDAVSQGATYDRQSFLPTELRLDRTAEAITALYREVLEDRAGRG